LQNAEYLAVHRIKPCQASSTARDGMPITWLSHSAGAQQRSHCRKTRLDEVARLPRTRLEHRRGHLEVGHRSGHAAEPITPPELHVFTVFAAILRRSLLRMSTAELAVVGLLLIMVISAVWGDCAWPQAT